MSNRTHRKKFWQFTYCYSYSSGCIHNWLSYKSISLPNMLKGTKFQVKVWNYIKTIPKGKVKTYKEVAIAINSHRSARAVANACAKNPYAPKIPCHRVIRSDGALGGYSGKGGIKTKKNLLKKEGFQL